MNRPRFAALASIVLCSISGLHARAADSPPPAVSPSPRPRPVVGEVTSVDADSGRLSLRSDDGSVVAVTLIEGAAVLKSRPGATDLTGATKLTLAEIAAGDRVMVRGAPGADKEIKARQVVVMARADISEKQAHERAEWRRGIAGVVTAVDAGTGEITVDAGAPEGRRPVVLATAGRKVRFRRYAHGSPRFADARESTLGDLAVGDQLRAVGEREGDGARFLPDQIVAGSFESRFGAVTSVDVEHGRIEITENGKSEPLAVVVGAKALLRRLPAEFAAMMAMRGGRPGEGGGKGGGEGRSGEKEGGGPGGGMGRGPGGGRMGGGNVTDMLDRLPEMGLKDLAVGDRVLVTTGAARPGEPLHAVTVVAGLEALAADPGKARTRAIDVGLPDRMLDAGMGMQ